MGEVEIDEETQQILSGIRADTGESDSQVVARAVKKLKEQPLPEPEDDVDG